jgi:hypothetical protein
VAGAGGIILYPKGKIKIFFSWGIGTSTNNQTKAYDLLQGLLLTKESNINL